MESSKIIKTIELLTGLKYKYNPNKFKGGENIEPCLRMAYNAYVVDFKRYYPHIIVQNNIFGDKMSMWIKSLLDSSINDSGDAKVKSKLTLNSIYGLMKHFDFEGVQKTTEIGRNWLRLTIALLKDQGYFVLGADTDSVTVFPTVSTKGVNINEHLKTITNVIKSCCINPIDSFKLEIENHFEFIYYFPNKKGFKKKQYLGVKLNGTLILKSKKLNFTEQLFWGVISNALLQGKCQVSEDEFIKFIDKYADIFHTHKRFINIENISIIEVTRPTISL